MDRASDLYGYAVSTIFTESSLYRVESILSLALSKTFLRLALLFLLRLIEASPALWRSKAFRL